MQLIINGESRDSAAATLDALWRAEMAEPEGTEPLGVAAAVNGVVVRHAAWMSTELRDGDRVEIVRVVRGG